MDKTQADAVSDAILEPHLRDQDARMVRMREKRAAAEVLMKRKRMAAGFALVGMAIGLAISHFSGFSFTDGAIWGGLAGATLSLLVRPRTA